MNVFDQFDVPPTAAPALVPEENVFDQFDSGTPQQVEVPKGPGFVSKIGDVARGELRGFETPDIPKPSFTDLIKGIPQGVAGVGTGIGSFVASLPMTIPKVVEGTLAGDPVGGIREAHKEAEKIREAWTYQPTTRAGKILAYDVAYPFMKAYQGLEAGVRAAGGDDKAVEVANYVADWALVGGPKAVGAIRKGKKVGKKPPPIPEEMLKNKVVEVAPDLPMEMVDAIAKAVEKHEVEMPPVPSGLKFEGNRAVVVGLRELAGEKAGFSKRAYEKAANIVSEMEGDISSVELKGVKGIGPKTQSAIEKILVEKKPEVEMDVPLEFPEVKPEIVEPPPIEVPKAVPETLKPEVPVDAAVIKSIKQPETPLVPEAPLPKFKTLKDAEIEFEIGSEISRKQAEIEFAVKEEGFSAAQVGDKYFRMVKKVSEEKWVEPRPKAEQVEALVEAVEPTARELREVELERFAKEPAPVVPVKGMVRLDGKTVPVADAAQAFSKWQESFVDKINQANPKARETSPLLGDEFKTFRDKEEGLAYLESKGQTGELLQDSMSKEWYIEPDFKVLDDYAWDRKRSPMDVVEKEGLWTEEVSLGEPGTGMVQDLVSLFNNEKGGVDITPMRVFADKLIDIIESAKKNELSLEEYLTKLKIAPEVQAEFMKAAKNLPKLQEELRIVDPVIEGIIRPPVEIVVRHRVKKDSKGKVVGKYVPLTIDQTKAVLGARKDPWKVTKPGKFMKAVETRIHAFERFGPKVKEMFWDPWVRKLTESERERKGLVKDGKALKKTLSKKELEAVNIHAYLDQHGGTEAVMNSGVTKIPPLTPKAAVVIEHYRGQYDRLIDRINYVRTKTGLEPIPKRDNYFPFIRAQNVLKERGILDSLVASPLAKIQGNLAQFKGTLFPFEKPRKVSDIPLELDIFNAYEKYLSYAMKEIHVAPIAALAKELATGRLKTKVGQKKGRKLADENPGLTNLLIEWSDDILGIDPIQSAISQKHPFVSRAFTDAHRNLVASMIFGNVGTVMKQPTALLGTYVGTSFPDLVYGISRVMVEKPFKWGESRAIKKSNVLDIRRAELILAEFAESIQMGVIKGKKKLAQQVTAAPMNIVDGLAAEAGWYSGYRHARKTLKYGEEQAIKFADDLVVKTHGMGIRGSVSPIQASGTYKWLTMLQTFAIADFNYLARDILGIKNPDISKIEQVKRVVKYVVGAALINEAFNAIGMDSPKPSPIRAFSESIEEDKDVKVATAKAFLELVEMMPIFGGSAKFGSSLFGPVGELAADIPEGTAKAVAAMDWEHMTKGQRLHTGLFLGQVLGAYYGIPMTNQIKKSIRAWASGGSGWEVVLGLYIEEKRKSGGPGGPP